LSVRDKPCFVTEKVKSVAKKRHSQPPKTPSNPQKVLPEGYLHRRQPEKPVLTAGIGKMPVNRQIRHFTGKPSLPAVRSG